MIDALHRSDFIVSPPSCRVSGDLPVSLRCFSIAFVAILVINPTDLLRASEPFVVIPVEVSLKGNFSQTQLLVSSAEGEPGSASADDLTHRAEYSSANEQVAVVTSKGQVFPRGDGSTEIAIRVGGFLKTVTVSVNGVVAEPAIDYLEQVRPTLYKAGCNMGACHAAQHGQGGFKLSVFGFDPQADPMNVAEELRRRVAAL